MCEVSSDQAWWLPWFGHLLDRPRTLTLLEAFKLQYLSYTRGFIFHMNGPRDAQKLTWYQDYLFVLLVLSILLLLAAYIPVGYLAPIIGLELGWERVISHTSFYNKLWGAWLIVACVIGNLQVILCFFSLTKPNIYVQNEVLKVAAVIGQLSWVCPGYMFYPWYFWVVGSAILFTITPNAIFAQNHMIPYARNWRESNLLSCLRKISNTKE